MEDWLDSSDWLLLNVYLRPDENAGNKERMWYWPVERKNEDHQIVKELSWKELFMFTTGTAMRRRGSSEEEIEVAFAEWFKGYTGVEQTVKRG